MKGKPLLVKAVAIFLAGTIVLSPQYLINACFAQNISVTGLTSNCFTPPLLKGIRVYPDNALRFDFIFDAGNNSLSDSKIKTEAAKLINYFLAAVTVPSKDLWVNLSPYEKKRIIPEALGVTEMGGDLLVQDSMLKQISAALTHPDTVLGKRFWEEAQRKLSQESGNAQLPVSTFNKVWIVPDKAAVYAKDGKAFITESRLKVMLEEDYLALRENKAGGRSSNASSRAMREVIVPEIEKQVNNSEAFAPLRQVYNSLILATWFKRHLRKTIFDTAYVGQSKVNGIDLVDRTVKEKVYNEYLVAFQKGAYNCIKKDYNPMTHKISRRQYFSGGFFGAETDRVLHESDSPALAVKVATTRGFTVSSGLDVKLNAPVVIRPTPDQKTSIPDADSPAPGGVSNTLNVVGFFPGMGSIGAYKNLGSTLYDTGVPAVRRVYEEAAQALGMVDAGGRPDLTQLFLTDANLATKGADKFSYLTVSLVVHNLALHEYFKALNGKNNTPVTFRSYTGESVGILSAMIASGGVSFKDGIKLVAEIGGLIASNAYRYTTEEYHVIGIERGHLGAALEALQQKCNDPL